RLTSAHTAQYLAERLVACFREYGIKDKTIAIMSDNAKTNDAMMREIKKLLPQSCGTEGRVQCF
ncbi:hypothetical protein BD311DRAFT_608863, partial [Dichomitus squalens]